MERRFGKALRDREPQEDDWVGPGPDAYQSNVVPEKQKHRGKRYRDQCSFGLKTQKFYQPNDNPSPATYFLETGTQKGVSISIPKSHRPSQESPVYTDKLYSIPDLNTSPRVQYFLTIFMQVRE